MLLLDKSIIDPVVVIIIMIIDLILYLFLDVIGIKGYKLKYLFLGKKYKHIKIDFVDEKIQRDYYRKTGKSIRDNYEYQNYIDFGAKNRLSKIISNFDYKSATQKEKMIFVVFNLYMACININADEFYKKTKDFAKKEILDLLNSIKMTEGLKDFIYKVVMENYFSIEAYKNVSELGGIIRFLSDMDDKQNELFFSDVIYDITKHKRYYPIKKAERLYVVCVEQYYDYSYFYKWNQLEESSIYETYDLAYKECKRLASLHSDSYEEEFNIVFNLNRWDRLWYLYSVEELDEELLVLCDYYSMINGDGHQCFFSNNENRLDKIISSLQKVLPNEFFKVIYEAYKAYGSAEEGNYASLADDYFYQHEGELEAILKDFAKKI